MKVFKPEVDMNDRVIKCDIHDYVEIACLYSIPVKLRFKDGSHQIVTPLNTLIDKERYEVLEVRERNQADTQHLRMTTIASMSALSANPHFSIVEFEPI